MENLYFSKIFHRASRVHPLLPEDPNEWPDEWKTTYYKTYPRLFHVKLLDESINANLFKIVKSRKSRNNFARKPITKQEFSLILKYSCGIMGILPGNRYRRAQPSGGAHFPIEVYPLIFRSGNNLDAGIYHYNVKDHTVEFLWKHKFSDQEINPLFTYPWVKNAFMVFLMTAVFLRTQQKYLERGYRYILLEAGHIGQNMYLVSEALGLKCCALGGTHDEALEKLLDIDGLTESIVYAVAVGR